MAITISGENNNDRILASDGVIDSLSGFNVVGVITATSFTGDLTGDVTGNLTGNVTGNINNSTLLLQTGGNERVRILSNGNVGIGTDTAPHRLSVKGTISMISGASGTQIVNLSQDGSNNGFIMVNDSSGTTRARLDSSGVSYVRGGDFVINDTTADGNVHPDTKLHVKGGITFRELTSASETALPAITQWSRTGTGQDLVIGARSNNGALLFYTGNAGTDGDWGANSNNERLRITSGGKVFIGANTGTAKLEISDAIGTTGEEVLLKLQGRATKNVYLDINADANRRGVIRFKSAGTDKWSIGRGDSDELSDSSFFIASGNSGGNTAKLVIDSSGKVGVNEASNINGRLHVQHDAAGENILYATRYNDQSNDKPILAITEAQMTGMTGGSGLVIGNHNRDIHIGPVFGSSAQVVTSSTSGLRITHTGRLLFGNHLNDRGAELQYEGSEHAGIGIHRNVNSHGSPSLQFSASRGTSAGSNTIVQNNDYLGMISFKGADGSDLASGAYITARVDGTPGNNDMPARLDFWTSPDGSQSPVERLRIASTGELGLGLTQNPPTGSFTMRLTETPEFNLYSTQHAQNNNCKINFGVGQSASVSGNTGARIEMNIPNAGGAMTGELKFFTNSGDNLQERLRIDSSGHLLPGADSSYYLGSSTVKWAQVNTDYLIAGLTNTQGSVASFKGGDYNQINIAHKTNSGWGLLLTNSDSNVYNQGYHTSTSGNQTPVAIINVNNDSLYLGTNNTARWRVEHDGHFIPFSDGSYDMGSTGRRVRRLYATNATNTTSDRNLKNTITESDLGLDFICKLKPVSYKWNQKEGESLDTKTYYGLISQDVEEVIYETGKTLNDFGAVDKPDGDPMGLSYNEFISPLIKAIQEQQEQIKTLETKIDALKGS